MIPYAEDFRVHVGTDYLTWQGISVYIASRSQGRLHLAEPVELTMSMLVEENVAYPDRPTMRIPDALGRALLEALSSHYGGVADVRQARNDLDLERKRVDQLIGVVSTIAVGWVPANEGR